LSAPNSIVAAFSEEQAERLTGISKAQLRYWDRTSFYRPAYAEENRRLAFSRVFSFKDIIALRVLNVLRNQCNISLQHLRDVRDRLGHLSDDPSRWTKTRLFPLNGRVVWYEEGSELPQVITSGQYVVSVVLEEIVQDTQAAVRALYTPRDKTQIGLIERSRFIVHNAAVIAGTRIPVDAIKRFSEAGYSPEQILKEYPDITKEDVEAAIAYREKNSAA
jgi:uncharacterized protein (DUF433 family)/DNA-binding transcriptional MerR regulator